MRLLTRILLLLILPVLSASGQVANFTADFTEGCAPLIVHFTNTSAGATHYAWDLGNGVTAPITDPSTSYIVAGTYTVTLTAYNGATASDTHRMIIQVYSEPVIKFGADDTTVCPGIPVTFTDSSISNAPGPLSYVWNFGDGSSATGANPVHSFNTTGYHNITLSATNSKGCSGTFSHPAYVYVYTPPSADFTVNSRHFCSLPANAVFTGSSTGTALSYSWSFGDGNVSTAASPAHSYTVSGRYSVSLTVNDGNGCSDTLADTSSLSAASLVSAFTRPDTACLNAPVTFTNTSSSHLSSRWLFGDGSSSAADLTAVHTYSVTGTYIVALIEFDGFCYDTASSDIGITTGPAASYVISPARPCPASANVTYKATVAGGFTPTWLFDDGTTGAGDTIVHNYTANGNHIVTMTAVNTWGCITKVTDSFLQYDLFAQIHSTLPRGCIPLGLQLGVEAYTNQPNSVHGPFVYPYGIASYTWDFGDGSATENTPLPAHTYTAIGIYHPSVTIVTSNGCTATHTINVTAGVPVTATFSVTPTHVCTDRTITFTAISDSADDFIWEFGDGYGDGSIIAHHAYTVPGIYTPTLTPYFNGCPGYPYVSPVNLSIDSPMSGFSVMYTCTSPVTNVSFTNTSLGADSHLWLFGDGTTSSALDPTHNYPSVSTYTARLATYNAASGCRDTFSWPVRVIDPVSDFFADDTTICKDGTIHITPVITGDTAMSTFAWLINGIADTIYDTLTITRTFTVTGSYTISLHTLNEHNCWDSVIKTNYIAVAKPVASFLAPSPTGCLPLTVNFTDNSTDLPGLAFTNFLWTFGDGASASVVTPAISHIYTASGTYDVQAIVTDSFGCMDTVMSTGLVITSHTDASFTVTPVHACAGSNIYFTRLYPGATGSLWLFGDGDTSSAPSSAHVYSATGTYSVMHVVKDPSGCADTVVKDITVTRPHASFTMSDTLAVCPPLFVTFTNSSANAASYAWSFGDGNSAVTASPDNVYAFPGYFTARLIAIDTNGCTDTAIGHARLYGAMGVFTTTPSVSGCAPLTVDFSASLGNVTAIVWDFADGNTSPPSLSTTATHTYSLPGAYLPKLILTDSNGCQTASPAADTIKVNGVTPGFIISPANLCLGSVFTCTDTSGSYWSSVTPRLWTFNGDSSTLYSPSFIADSAGIFAVTVYVSNDSGCSGTATHYISVSKPIASFTASSHGGCIPHTVTFSDQSTDIPGIGFINFEWSFGDGANSSGTVSIISHTYTASGTYTVQEIVTDAQGCTDTAVSTALINVSKANASFMSSTLRSCVGSNISFTRLYPGSTGSQWFFGDGATSTLISPAHAYTASGTYTVMHVVTDPSGCIDTSRYVNYITITKPHASFTLSDTVICAPQLITFTNTSTSAATYTWSFGDGQASAAANPGHTYSLWGYLPATLIATDIYGCPDTATRYVRVRGASGSFTATPNQGCAPVSVSFNATISHAASLVWDFADGATSAPSLLTATAHTYSLTGTHLPRLLLTDSFGCHTTIPAPDTIKIDLIRPGFTVSQTTLCRGSVFTCTDTSLTALSTITSTLWTYRGYTSTSATPSFTADTVGSYPVTLQVTNGSGCSGTATATISASGPTTTFTAPSPGGCIPHTATFTDHSTDASGVTFTSYQWSFGDGSAAVGPLVSHTYTVPGIYNVQEIVTNSLGCADTMISTALVNVSQTDAAFTADITRACAGSTIMFTPSHPGAYSSQWFFGDSAASSLLTPAHVYTASGTYTVMHVATDPSGCIDTAQYVNYITVTQPNASFISVASVCAAVSVTFTNNSTGAATYSWDFGDGNTAAVTTPGHAYTLPGIYPVTLIATDTNGCTDTATRNINILGATGSFIDTPAHGCAPLLVNFQMIRSLVDSIVCDFADGTIITIPVTAAVVNHNYLLPGAYLPVMMLWDASGCRTTITATDTIKVDKIQAGYTTPEHLCRDSAFNCIDTTVSYWSAITSRRWTFMNDTSSAAAPWFAADTPGAYPVSLYVTNASGCSDTETKMIYVYPPPDTGIITGPSVVCKDASVILMDTVTGGTWLTSSATIATIIPFEAGAVTATGLSAGVNIISYIVTNGFCADTATKTITVYGLQSIDTIAGQSRTCTGAQFTLVNPTAGGHWSSDNTPVAAIDSSSGIVRSLAAGTANISYTVGPDSNGCFNAATFTVTVTAHATFLTDSSISQITCYGNNNGMISITINDALFPITYLWSNDSTTASISGLTPGGYTLTISEIPTQCIVTDSFYISEPDSITVTPFVTNDPCHKNMGSIHIDATGGTQPLSYMWPNNTTGTDITGLNSGTYPVTITDGNSCIKVYPITVNDDSCLSIIIPDAITPNGDGINDTWVIEALSLYPDNSVRVFDKWGDAVYEKTNYQNDWRGTGKNAPLPDGTYFYVIKLNAQNLKGGNTVFTGAILIKR